MGLSQERGDGAAQRGRRAADGWGLGVARQCVGWPEVEEDDGHYGQLRHYSNVSLFHNGIF
jgi:hypothetical protein